VTGNKKLIDVALAAIVMLLPLLFVPARYKRLEPWIVFLGVCVILFTQPAVGLREMMDRGSADRRSALAIFVGQITAQLAAILDFGYWHGPVPRLAGAMFLSGLVLLVGGLWFRIWAIRTLGCFFTSTVQVRRDQTVVDRGPYGWLRHPSYAGALAGAIGATFVLNSLLGAALVLLLSVPAYVIRMSAEERELADKLGEPYRAYTRRTKRLVPFVY
jgi:protein-S-isoprenylcysteine O-methyltransferase Ste14